MVGDILIGLCWLSSKAIMIGSWTPTNHRNLLSGYRSRVETQVIGFVFWKTIISTKIMIYPLIAKIKYTNPFEIK